jgi:hypothetical protein
MGSKFLLIFVAIVVVWVYFAFPPLALYSNDEGAKHIQMKSFYLNHWQKLAIEYPGEEIGLDFSYLNPTRYFAIRNSVLFCTYSPSFTFFSSLFYPLLGDRVTHFLPLLSLFLSFALLAKTLELVMRRGIFYYLLLFVFLIASPVYLYSLTFSEHLPAVFLVMVSLYYLTRYFKKSASNFNLFMSAFPLGIAVFFRTEIFFLIASFAVALGWVIFKNRLGKKIIVVAVGFAVPISVYCLTNFIFYGSWLGLHEAYHKPYHFSLRMSIIYTLCLFIGGCAAYIVNRHKDRELVRHYYSFILILWLVVILVFFNLSPVSALFLGFPLVIMLFFNAGQFIEEIFTLKPSLDHLILIATVVYISLTAIFFLLNPDLDIRYLLAVVPLTLVYLGMRSREIEKFKPLYITLLLLIGAGFLANGSALKNRILRYNYYNLERVKFLESHTQKDEVVIFQANPLMEHCGPLFFERIYIVSKNGGGDLKDILTTLKTKGIRSCYYWTMDPNFVKSFSAETGYKLSESEFASKLGPPHYLVKITLAS